MNKARRSPRLSGSSLFVKLRTAFPDDPQTRDLLAEFLQHKSYDHNLCLRLLTIARQKKGVRWSVRKLAILMLEHQVLKLAPGNSEEFNFILRHLSLVSPEPGATITPSVLREGFSTTDQHGFITEFRRKLERLNRVHDQIRGLRTSESALREFVDLAGNDCKLSLARYLFTPDEVVDEIRKRLRITRGVRDLDPSEPHFVTEEMRNAIRLLPSFESRILRELCQTSNIYWVSKKTSSQINSLVEYPLTTVVLVIKPPGSDVEFEIKRAGRRGDNSLNVVYKRNGNAVPPSHRLDGGSMQWLLRYEATHGSKLGYIYRHTHGAEAPMANFISRSTISSVPTADGEAQVITYFTDERAFGSQFREMRTAMKKSVASFRSEGYGNLPELPGDLGLTAQFIGQVTPGQAILAGTSSFRLDKLAAYLSTNGPSQYFGPDTNPSAHALKMFVDAVLEEVLGCYRPPGIRYTNHERYLKAAFAVDENRVRAERVYLSLLQQIARFWGTLLAVRGYARGESFVARNVGLRTFWNNGQWDVKIVFMDHDALVIPNSPSGRFFAFGDIPNMIMDERYIWGPPGTKRFAVSEVGYLQSIYRVNDDVKAEGEVLARLALKRSYQATQQAVLTKPELRRLFSKGILNKLLDWDTLVSGYLTLNGDKAAVTNWKRRMRKMLSTKGYPADAFDVYLSVIKNNKAFLERQSFLYQQPGRSTPGKQTA
jgi:hypothetical protein